MAFGPSRHRARNVSRRDLGSSLESGASWKQLGDLLGADLVLMFKPLWGPLVASLGPLGSSSWVLLGCVLWPPGCLSGRKARMFGSRSPSWAPRWALVGCIGTVMGASWAVFGVILCRLGVLLGASWAVLGLSWGPLGPSWSVGSSKKREPHKNVGVMYGHCTDDATYGTTYDPRADGAASTRPWRNQWRSRWSLHLWRGLWCNLWRKR